MSDEISFDPLEILLEEVSLEGLDGITLSALWLRLKTRQNAEVKLLDDHWKRYYFDLLKSHPNISCYELPQERGTLSIFDFKEHMEPQTQVYIEPSIDKAPVDIYPYVAVNDEDQGIMGSCSTYNTRKNITGKIKEIPYEKVCEIFGNKLVFVASQQLRAKYLMMTKEQYVPTNFELTVHSYCLLERIGRCRQHGCIDITKEKVKLVPKDIFYHRKELLSRKWITKQTINKHRKKGGILRFNLYYLNRFHVVHKSKLTNFMQTILETLKDASSTNYILPIKSFNNVFSCVTSLSVKKLVNFFRLDDKVKELDLPYSQVFPLLPQKACFTANNKEKLAPCIQLLEPDINIEKELNKDFDNLDDAGSDEEEDDVEECEEDKIKQEVGETQSQESWLNLVDAFTNVESVSDLSERESLASYPDIEESESSENEFVEETMEVSFLKKKGFLIEKEVPFDLSLKKQFMKVVEQAGPKGCSAVQIQKNMKLSRCDIRNLIKHGLVYLHVYLKDEGRQRSQYFRLKKYTNCKTEYNTNTSSILSDVPCKKLKLDHENTNISADYSKQDMNEAHFLLEKNKIDTAEKKLYSRMKDVTSIFTTDLQRHRACDAIECISKKGFNIGYNQVYNYIADRDKVRNISNKLDRKTVHRLLNKLAEHGLIKIVDIVVKTDMLVHNEKRVRVYAENDMDIESEAFRAAVQQTQMKFYDTKSLYVSSNNIKSEHEIEATDVHKKIDDILETINDCETFNTEAGTEKNYQNNQPQKEDIGQIKLKIFENISVEINTIQPSKQPIKNLKLLYPSDVMIHRANDCLDYIRENHVIVGSKNLQYFITKRDTSRDYHAKIDYKTIKRLIEILSLNNFINCFIVKFKNLENGFEKDVFICSIIDITQEHSEFSNVLKKEKLLFVGESNSQSNKTKHVKSNDYISLPKFAKMEKMHKIAFHVAYSSTKPLEDQELARRNLECNARVTIPADHPVIYNDSELNDFTFLPTLCTPKSCPQGFFNFEDFYSVLPIGTLLQCLGRESFAHSLDEYYRDPVRQFYPIKDTDTSVYTLVTRQFDGRKNVNNVYNIFVNLAAIGLVQLGKRLGGEKENFLVYVNKKTSLRDTMKATPSYQELDPDTIKPPEFYNLNDDSDVKKYWMDSCFICVNTPLGLRAYAIGQKVNSYKRISDKAVLSEVCKHNDDVNTILSRDNGHVPGDGLGAAGYDTILFAHMKKNWNAVSKIMKAPIIVKPTRNTKKLKKLFRQKKSSKVEKKPIIVERIVKARQEGKKKKAKKAGRSKIIENSSVSEHSRRRLRTQITWNAADADVLHLTHILYKQFKLKKCNRLTRDILVKLLDKKSKTRDILSSKMLLSHYCRVLKISENKERCSLLEAEVNHREEIRSFLLPHIMKHRELCKNDKNKAHQYIFDHFLQIVKTIFEMVVVDNNSLRKDYFPTNYQQLLEEYSTIDAVERLDDLYPVTNTRNNIKIHGLLNLIHSSLASGSYMKNENLTTCLFDAYQQYSEPLIHKAVRILKKLHIIASSKYINKQLRNTNNSNAPISIARFKLSVRYISRVTQTDMQCNSFHGSYIRFKEMSQSQDSVQTLKQVDSGYFNLLIVLFCKDVKMDIKIPDTLLLFNPKLQKKNQDIVDRYYQLVDYYKAGTIGKNVSEQEGEENDEDEDDEKQGNIPPMNLFNASRLAMYTLKDFLVKEHVSAQHVNKLLTLNTCKVLVGKRKLLLDEYDYCKSEAYIKKLSQRIVVPALNQEQINVVLTPGLEKELEQFILSKLEAGATSEDIRLKFGASRKMKSTLERLVDKKVVISAGCVLVTYVHNTCCSPWLLKINNTHNNDPTDSSKKEIIIAPWIHVDSSVNRPVLDYMLCIILSYIMFHPGVTLLYLQEQFASVLHPKHIIDLIDILVSIKCVSIQIVCTVQATLLTRGSVKVLPATLLEPSHSIHIEALFDAGVKLGVFIGEKSYEEDYLSDILGKNVDIEE